MVRPWPDQPVRLLRLCVIPCDIFCDNPLLVKQEPFEIISSSLCLEVACTTYAEYKVGVKKLLGLLKPAWRLSFVILCRT